MKRMILFLSIILIGCDNNELVDRSDTFSFSLIGKGELSGNGEENIEESQLVLKDSASWDKLKTKMDSYNLVSDEFDSEINFETEVVIAIFDQVRGRTDYSFRIKKIAETASEVVVFYEQNKTEDGYTVMNQPYIIIKIPKTGKEITFNKNQIPFKQINT